MCSVAAVNIVRALKGRDIRNKQLHLEASQTGSLLCRFPLPDGKSSRHCDDSGVHVVGLSYIV